MALSASCGGDEPLEAGPSAIAERGRIERIVIATGTIEPEHEVETRPRISGIVERIHVEAGDPVAVDQPLLEIDKELRRIIDAALERASRAIGVRIRAVPLPFPEAAIDVDRVTDLMLAERILAEREVRASGG